MKIEKNVSMPEPANKKYPFADMSVGDSILAEGVSATPAGCRAYNAAKSYGRYHGKKFIGRRDAKDPSAIRIWRVA